MREITLVKLGGSLITNKSRPYTARPRVIERLAREIKMAWDEGFRFLVAHGSGSFGHTSAAKYATAEGLKNKKSVYGLAVVQQDAIKINRIVNEIFLKVGLPVLSFIPSSFTIAKNKKLTSIFTRPIVEALKIGALPLVFGDIILDKRLGCCIYSGETTLDNLIEPLSKEGYRIDKVIQCGNTDGVYDGQGKTVARITPRNFKKIAKELGNSAAIDVTGGMLHKVEECLKMAKRGIDCLIINGETKGNLFKAITGKEAAGTLIAAC